MVGFLIFFQGNGLSWLSFEIFWDMPETSRPTVRRPELDPLDLQLKDFKDKAPVLKEKEALMNVLQKRIAEL